MTAPPLMEARGVGQRFGSVVALHDVSLAVRAGEVLCLLGDNGAGKSTLVQLLAGVRPPERGSLRVDGRPVVLRSPREARRLGIAAVFQDLALVPLLSASRNFFLGREPTRRLGPLRVLDLRRADAIVRDELARLGISLRDPSQSVGTLSGGERQCLAIARAVYFGARLLILDEPTAALGAGQASAVLSSMARARERGLGVVFITHNAHHAYPLGDRFLVLQRGRAAETWERGEISREELAVRMAGGRELERPPPPDRGAGVP